MKHSGTNIHKTSSNMHKDIECCLIIGGVSNTSPNINPFFSFPFVHILITFKSIGKGRFMWEIIFKITFMCKCDTKLQSFQYKIIHSFVQCTKK